MMPCRKRQEMKRLPSGSGGAYFPGGCYEYSRTFMAPEEWERPGCDSEFEGIYPMAEISLNGCKVGSCSYGYSGYRFYWTICPWLREHP